MARIQIENMHGKTIDCSDENERVLDILLRNVDWMHACGGKGRCTTCKMIVLDGFEDLPPMNDSELNFFNLQRLSANERLTCQVRLTSHLTIRVAEENKLPHVDYSE